eukprot:2905582-Rhodomonas_salina.2
MAAAEPGTCTRALDTETARASDLVCVVGEGVQALPLSDVPHSHPLVAAPACHRTLSMHTSSTRRLRARPSSATGTMGSCSDPLLHPSLRVGAVRDGQHPGVVPDESGHSTPRRRDLMHDDRHVLTARQQ